MKDDSYQDDDLAKIMKELEDEDKKSFQGYNRNFFSEDKTPSNTPMNKNTPGVDLKNVNFENYLNNKLQNYEENCDPDQIIDSKRKSYNHCHHRCYPVFLGNSLLEIGVTNNSLNPKICGNLLCLKCDMKVKIFKNQRWDSSCDYLFFRNNFGNVIKLSEKLINSENCVCYSCQCSWINIDEDYKTIDCIPSVNWTCAGHI